MPLRVLIVDDEPPARLALERLLRALPAVEVVGSVGDGLEALRRLAVTDADLLLLDIEMPVLAGIELATRLHPAVTPVVVFVTAYPRYASRAFDVQAADYLLKPVAPARLALALERARARLAACNAGQRIAALEAALHALRASPAAAQPTHVWVEFGRGRKRLALNEIEWFAADGDYVQAHVTERSYLMRDSLNHLEAVLSAARFLRIHRSTLVNLDAVDRVGTAANGQLLLAMRNGGTLPVGRRSRGRVRGVLGTRACHDGGA
ncbi:LytTR family DNA-binding domain-containing protein [Fulvimonas sp. R45]|uniref:LytR/AlgR family response regulator transcription factor n=1 Tax=Fulvimonas sp. R45 TaxID=3045937 RepID=UPI00265EF08D|nr:LytTR family DNA-binding domain-containing protein [Fulvimonas sp. R45]MDO1529647.1 LytTR family DNA-binding domain-containing protein [Fulvimonas sp. R45]